MLKCDVIVPIYNAYECLKDCIESVLKNTDFKKTRLVLIDDKSTDERVLPLLLEYEKKYKDKITVLKNQRNLGFVGTVNRGMRYSKNDVLLLNSDTEVPKGWLERIMECAYSDGTIATVTPLSNNATLASVPKIFVRNELPEKYSLKKMDKIVQTYSVKDYPDIPTAHGFCMYIKREALEKVGYFDENNFGKGYGEENDFSFRCFEFGYRNVLCDNVYVLHKESQSFLDEKKDNGIVLGKKHPELKRNLDEWCRVRDIKRIGENIALALGVQDIRPNILILIHDFSNFNDNVGGTTLHVMDLIRELRSKYNFHVLYPEGCFYKLHSFFENSDTESAIFEKPFTIEQIGLYNNQYKRIIESILDDYGISFVHIHHMIGHYFDIGDVCRMKKIRYAVSLHDMYLEEPIISMLDKKVDSKRLYPVDLTVWRKECGKLLRGAKNVIAPSTFVKDIYEGIYNCKIKVISHGVNVEKIEADNKLSTKKNIAFVGAIFPHKGSYLLEGLAEQLRSGDNVKIHLFGMTTANIKGNKFYANHGPYKREELGKLLKRNKIDLVCVLSLAPESFAYTVEEVVAAGVPVLTFNIGAAEKRVKENNLGWVMKYTDEVSVIYRTIKTILNNEAEYYKVIESINNYSVKNVVSMATEYSEIYNTNSRPVKLDYDLLRKNIFQASFVENVVMRCNRKDYAEDYFAVINSRKWKMISKIKIPSNSRKVAKKVYHLIKGKK